MYNIKYMKRICALVNNNKNKLLIVKNLKKDGDSLLDKKLKEKRIRI